MLKQQAVIFCPEHDGALVLQACLLRRAEAAVAVQQCEAAIKLLPDLTAWCKAALTKAVHSVS